ncbi:hypothetical protein NBO_3g0057 [Nosema bombycis CQ1]|uniref:Uncharacterized protein n=1 Tax=Nosema bombycis (strain CQ1 / CVCC 102059) TaxID=578461 RepID=R0KX85_NOSB1|nr:hypothetical protein NBO_3g0057 [Nosema bombycis CQ1]|eukprot:EOB15506.1 hypothetical protein NBO_3g0057 [Nosema bombycis CQ1]
MVSFFLFYIFEFIKSSFLNEGNVIDECCINEETFCIQHQQEDIEFLKNLEFDRFLIEDLGLKYRNNLSNPSEPFILYYCHKRSTFNYLFMFISTVLNNLISIFDLEEIEKIVYGYETPEKILLLNCNQIFYCFWAINSLSKSRFRHESEIKDVPFEDYKTENFINTLNNFNHKERVLYCNCFYWKNIPSFEEYDIKSKIKYLLRKFAEIKRFQKLFKESVLILIFCYELPDNFLLNNKYQLIENFISKMAFLFEVVKHEDKIKNEELYLRNLSSSIDKSNKIICQYKHPMN